MLRFSFPQFHLLRTELKLVLIQQMTDISIFDKRYDKFCKVEYVLLEAALDRSCVLSTFPDTYVDDT
jgi:hypothetical protein